MLRPKWPLAPAAKSSHPKLVSARLVDSELTFLILPGISRNVYLESSRPMQIDRSVIICDRTCRKLVVNTFPEEDIFHTQVLEFQAIAANAARPRCQMRVS